MGAARASFLALLLCWAVAAFADVAVPPLTGRVVDQTGTLNSDDIASLTQKLRDFEAKKGTQIAVLIVPTTAPESIEQYSIRVADAWKVGRKKVDDGAILLVAKNDRKLRIETRLKMLAIWNPKKYAAAKAGAQEDQGNRVPVYNSPSADVDDTDTSDT